VEVSAAQPEAAGFAEAVAEAPAGSISRPSGGCCNWPQNCPDVAKIAFFVSCLRMTVQSLPSLSLQKSPDQKSRSRMHNCPIPVPG